MSAGASVKIGVPQDLKAASLWARTNCITDSNGFECETGGGAPVTLAEFTLNGWGEQDYYDVSLVDGYNLMVTINPTDKSSTHGSGNYWCKKTDCVQDLNKICPKELQLKSLTTGEVIGCYSACESLKTDQYCCRGAYGIPENCKSRDWPKDYPYLFKMACPTAYSYNFDYETRTFLCKDTDYEITFCLSVDLVNFLFASTEIQK
jgi:hypothetical protein